MLTASIYSLLGIQILVCFLMILVVLMQRPKSEGLGAAFGGGMTENLFGAQTTSVLANFTRWLGGIFLFLSLVLSILYSRQSNANSVIQQQLMHGAKSAAVVAPANAAPKSAGAVSTAPGMAVAVALATPGTAKPLQAPKMQLAMPSAAPTEIPDK
jgi:preprotein translocase subunit SecG